VPTDRITIDQAISQLSALEDSLEQSKIRDRKPSKEELYHFSYIVVLLQMSGFNVNAAIWNETDTEASTYPHAYQVLPQVTALIAELGRIRSASPQRQISFPVQKGYTFIVMAMKPDDPALDDIKDAIVEACQGFGLQAERIDDVQNTAKVTDTMIECLRKAEVVIADLTHNRPNCFYEAGYAHGLDKKIIFLARKDTDLHFDIKDYPVIFYDNMKRLREQLSDRLSAVLDRG
jgi:hypothetical protein